MDEYESAEENDDQDHDDSPLLINLMDTNKKMHPASMSRFLSSTENKSSNKAKQKHIKDANVNNVSTHDTEITLNGKVYCQVNVCMQ